MLPGTSQGLFLHDFFAKILPKERSLFAPTRQAVGLGQAHGQSGTACMGRHRHRRLRHAELLVCEEPRDHEGDSLRSSPGRLCSRAIWAADLDTMEQVPSPPSLKVHDKNESWWIPRLGLSAEQGCRGNG
ncbi:MAG: hypothetical protein MZV70_53420 [Desulfobacterales bacterium]|nr:hypothetical protein [Desulfobacterales bacterium]